MLMKALNGTKEVAEDFIIIYVDSTPLVVSILGGSSVKLPQGTNMSFDGANSYDPDTSAGPGRLACVALGSSL